jgi:hypothetical protein
MMMIVNGLVEVDDCVCLFLGMPCRQAPQSLLEQKVSSSSPSVAREGDSRSCVFYVSYGSDGSIRLLMRYTSILIFDV